MNCTQVLFRRGFCKILPTAWPSPLCLPGTCYIALFLTHCWKGLRPFLHCLLLLVAFKRADVNRWTVVHPFSWCCVKEACLERLHGSPLVWLSQEIELRDREVIGWLPGVRGGKRVPPEGQCGGCFAVKCSTTELYPLCGECFEGWWERFASWLWWWFCTLKFRDLNTGKGIHLYCVSV